MSEETTIVNNEDSTDTLATSQDVSQQQQTDDSQQQQANQQDDPNSGSTDGQADKDKQVGAPEKYEDFVLPDGMELDQQLMDKFQPLAKELNLTQEQAQKLIDIQTADTVASEETRAKEWEDLQNSWQEASKTDKEFGGLQLKENLGVAKLALDKFGTDGLREALDTTGTGNHPEFIRFLFRVGSALKEDGMLSGSAPQAPTDVAKILFPNQN